MIKLLFPLTVVVTWAMLVLAAAGWIERSEALLLFAMFVLAWQVRRVWCLIDRQRAARLSPDRVRAASQAELTDLLIWTALDEHAASEGRGWAARLPAWERAAIAENYDLVRAEQARRWAHVSA